MKIILKEDVVNLGKGGELKEVKPGYARNFLFPKNLAIPATKSAVKKINEEIKNKKTEKVKLKKEAENKAKILEGQKITIQVKAEKGGKLFGALSQKEIAKNIKKQLNLDLDPEMIKIATPIKKIGDYKVGIILHKEVEILIDLKVVEKK